MPRHSINLTVAMNTKLASIVTKRQWSIIQSLIIATLPVIAICLTCPPHYTVIDDQVQLMFVKGMYYNTQEYLMPYTLAPISAPLELLYRMSPIIPWYALCLLLSIIVSTAVMLRLASKTSNTHLRLLLFSLLLAIEAYSTVNLTYTSVAFLLGASGLSLLTRKNAIQKPEHYSLSDLVSIVLICAAVSMRPESGFACFGIFLPYFIWAILCNRNIRTFGIAIISTAASVIVYAIGMLAYYNTPGWKSFPSILSEGRGVMDMPRASTESIQTLAPTLSNNDIDMMYSWYIADKGVFSIDQFTKIRTVVDGYSLSNMLDNGKKSIAIGVMMVIIICIFIAIAHMFLDNTPLTWLNVGIAISMTAMLSIYALRGRMFDHVIYPTFFSAIYALVPTCTYTKTSNVAPTNSMLITSRLTRATSILCLLLLIIIPVANHASRMSYSEETRQHSILVNSISDYLNQHRNTIFMLSTSFDHQNVLHNVFDIEEYAYPTNACSGGGWRIWTGPWAHFYKMNNLDGNYLFEEFVNRTDFKLIDTEQAATKIKAYLEEHTGRNITYSVDHVFPGKYQSTSVSVFTFTEK